MNVKIIIYLFVTHCCRVVEAQAYWPDSLRACYGRRTNYSEYFNALHGSENHAEALREIHFFFPNSTLIFFYIYLHIFIQLLVFNILIRNRIQQFLKKGPYQYLSITYIENILYY